MPIDYLAEVTKRSVEKDFGYYDPPEEIWKMIHGAPWPYKTRQTFYEKRDRALIALEYLSTSRVSELVRANLHAGYKASVRKSQFHQAGDHLNLSGLIVLKRRELVLNEEGTPVFDERGRPSYKTVENFDVYPRRRQIPLPLTGDLSRFTGLIVEYLNELEENAELFKFYRARAHTIVKHITGKMNHFFRAMGLKMYIRLMDRNLTDLQKFSGHKRIEILMAYLEEGQLERQVLDFKINW